MGLLRSEPRASGLKPLPQEPAPRRKTKKPPAQRRRLFCLTTARNSR
ncbi:hypothetical protein [Lysobacter gummosus]